MILNELANSAKLRVNKAKEEISTEEIKSMAYALPRSGFRFERTLKQNGLSFICEIKKASPSKGIIAEDFPYLCIAKEYTEAGADCISCLTEPTRFLGSDQIFREIRSITNVPMLRKDFTVDEYQIYEAKVMGANAVLLICAFLDTKTLARYLKICDTLGMTALFETHDETEISTAVSVGARVIGVNNRNLKDFSVDISNSVRLCDKIPPEIAFVAESGISCAADVAMMEKAGADAVLVGEVLMRSADKKALLNSFREAAKW